MLRCRKLGLDRMKVFLTRTSISNRTIEAKINRWYEREKVPINSTYRFFDVHPLSYAIAQYLVFFFFRQFFFKCFFFSWKPFVKKKHEWKEMMCVCVCRMPGQVKAPHRRFLRYIVDATYLMFSLEVRTIFLEISAINEIRFFFIHQSDVYFCFVVVELRNKKIHFVSFAFSCRFHQALKHRQKESLALIWVYPSVPTSMKRLWWWWCWQMKSSGRRKIKRNSIYTKFTRTKFHWNL